MATYNVGYNAAGTLLDFATINDAYVGSSAGDTLVFWYSDTNRNTKWFGQFNAGVATAKNLNLIGGLPNQKATILYTNIIYYWTPDVPGAAMTIQNLSFRGINAASGAVQFRISGSTENCSFIMDSCRLLGGFTYGIQAYALFPQTIKNCYFNGINRATYAQTDSIVYFNNNTTIDCLGGIYLLNSFGEIKNCVFINSGSVQYFGSRVTASHNVSTATAPGDNATSNVIADTLRFWSTDLGGYNLESPQIFPDSVLASGGTAITGISTDIDGLDYDSGVTPRGCSRGRDILPSRSRVLSTETYNGSVPLSGLFVNVDPAAVLTGETWGYDDEFTGTYEAGSSLTRPTIAAEDLGDGETIEVTITGSDLGTTNSIFAQPRAGGPWALLGTISGDDSAEYALAPGRYWLVAESSAPGATTISANLVALDLAAALPPAAEGPLSLMVEAFRALLAACPTWQALTGSATADEARARVFAHALSWSEADLTEGDYLANTVKAARPYALVGLGDSAPFTRSAVAGGGMTYTRPGGKMIFFIEVDVPEALRDLTRLSEAEIWFENQLGNLIEDIAGLNGLPGVPDLREIRLLAAPVRASEEVSKSEGDFSHAFVEVSWGLR